jgi:hypothetical protein
MGLGSGTREGEISLLFSYIVSHVASKIRYSRFSES